MLSRSRKETPLTAIQTAAALAILRVRWEDAELRAGQPTDDHEGAVVEFYLPSAQWGRHATILVRWGAGSVLTYSGHYFDDEWPAHVDYLVRVDRGY